MVYLSPDVRFGGDLSCQSCFLQGRSTKTVAHPGPGRVWGVGCSAVRLHVKLRDSS